MRNSLVKKANLGRSCSEFGFYRKFPERKTSTFLFYAAGGKKSAAIFSATGKFTGNERLPGFAQKR
jgi:hypothetical protein